MDEPNGEIPSDLLDALESTDPNVVCEGLGGLADLDPAPVAHIARFLSHADPLVSDAAGQALAMTGAEEAMERLLLALADPNIEEVAVKWLSDFKHPRVGEALSHRLHHADAETRAWAAMGVGKARKRDSWRVLVDLLQDDASSVREHAAAALGCLEVSDATPFLVKSLRDREELVRSASAEALARIATIESRAALRLLTGDSNPIVRHYAEHAEEKPRW